MQFKYFISVQVILLDEPYGCLYGCIVFLRYGVVMTVHGFFLCQIYFIDIAPWLCSSVHSCGVIVRLQIILNTPVLKTVSISQWGESLFCSLYIRAHLDFKMLDSNKKMFFSICVLVFCVSSELLLMMNITYPFVFIMV